MGGWSPAWPPESAALKSAGRAAGGKIRTTKHVTSPNAWLPAAATQTPEPATIESATQGEFRPTSADMDGWMWGWCWRRAQRPFRPQFRTRRLPIDLLPTGLRGPVFVGPDALVWIPVGLGTNSSMRTRNLRLAAPALLLPKMGPNERSTNVSRTAARLPTPLDVSILFSSRDFDNMSVHRQQSTKLHREAPARREDAQKESDRRPPTRSRPRHAPRQPTRRGFFFSPPLRLPALPPTCYIAREKRPHPLARPRPLGSPFVHPAPPTGSPTYLHAQLAHC